MVLPPSRGAPASGPGRMSQRTDLSPSGQPTRLPSDTSDSPRGTRQALERQQNAAPMQAQAPAGLTGGAFGPTARASEPITAGAPLGPGPGPAGPTPPRDPDMLVRALYRMTRHPDLERLLLRRRPVR